MITLCSLHRTIRAVTKKTDVCWLRFPGPQQRVVVVARLPPLPALLLSFFFLLVSLVRFLTRVSRFFKGRSFFGNPPNITRNAGTEDPLNNILLGRLC